jgi:hypothetical protein
MATHMHVGVEHFAEAYAEYLEPESTSSRRSRPLRKPKGTKTA